MLEQAGRALFRWRSFTPLPLIAVAIPLLWRSRGPASALWYLAGLLLCLFGQALRAWVLGLVPEGTSGQNETLEADRLNTTGPYALTRNPLYLGNLAITLGLCLIAHDLWLLAAVALLFALQYAAIIAAEEKFLAERFGEQYEANRAGVRRFWPRFAKVQAAPWNWERALKKEHNPASAWLAIAVVLVALDHRTRWPYALALALLAAAWLSVKGWKHRWLRGGFAADLRRRLSAR